jgi:hypothetical protein
LASDPVELPFLDAHRESERSPEVTERLITFLENRQFDRGKNRGKVYIRFAVARLLMLKHGLVAVFL